MTDAFPCKRGLNGHWLAAAFVIDVASAITAAAIPVFATTAAASLDVNFATAATALIDVCDPALVADFVTAAATCSNYC